MMNAPRLQTDGLLCSDAYDRRRGKTFVFVLSLLFLTCLIRTSGNETATTLGIIEKWIEVRKSDAQLRRDWLEEKQQLEHEEKMLLAESDSLSRRVEALREINGKLIQERATQGSLAESLQSASEGVEVLLARHSERLNQLLPKLPPPLARSISEKLSRNDSTNNGLGARYQRIISAITEVHEFAANTHWKVEIRETDNGEPRQFDTLYWGLNYALSCDKMGTVSQIGFPLGESWQWEDADEHAQAVRSFLDGYQGLVAPSFLPIPAATK